MKKNKSKKEIKLIVKHVEEHAQKQAEKKIESSGLAFIGIIANLGLFILKLIGSILSGSISLMADTINSLTDIITSCAVWLAVKISHHRADSGHPFGHARVEPLAAFTVAIFTGIFGFELLKTSIQNIWNPIIPEVSFFIIAIPVITIIAKGSMYIVFSVQGKKRRSPALEAIAVDARNDVFTAALVLFSILASLKGWIYVDSIVAVLISLFVFYAGYKLASENTDYLIGKAAPHELVEKIKEKTIKMNHVLGINDVRAHYVGNLVHIEIHIEVEKNMSTLDSHTVGKNVQHMIEVMHEIDKAFIHIDPR